MFNLAGLSVTTCTTHEKNSALQFYTSLCSFRIRTNETD